MTLAEWEHCMTTAAQNLTSEQREQSRFEKAKKIRWDEWNGPVYCDGYYEDVGTFLDMWDDDDFNPPKYVWACKSTQFAQVDLDKIVEWICDRSYEGFEPDELTGLKELEVEIDRFNQFNKHLVAWDADYSTAILLENGGGE